MRSPIVAVLLSSLVPGLGQWYAGDRPKAVALLCVSAGIMGGIALALVGPEGFRSWLTVAMLGLIYPVVWVPAIIDAYQSAAGAAKPLLSSGNQWYVLAMLLSVGPMALPLLWQSARFSKPAKLIWTGLVILVAMLCIWLALVAGPKIQQLLEQYQNLPGVGLRF